MSRRHWDYRELQVVRIRHPRYFLKHDKHFRNAWNATRALRDRQFPLTYYIAALISDYIGEQRTDYGVPVLCHGQAVHLRLSNMRSPWVIRSLRALRCSSLPGMVPRSILQCPQIIALSLEKFSSMCNFPSSWHGIRMGKGGTYRLSFHRKLRLMSVIGTDTGRHRRTLDLIRHIPMPSPCGFQRWRRSLLTVEWWRDPDEIQINYVVPFMSGLLLCFRFLFPSA